MPERVLSWDDCLAALERDVLAADEALRRGDVPAASDWTPPPLASAPTPQQAARASELVRRLDLLLAAVASERAAVRSELDSLAHRRHAARSYANAGFLGDDASAQVGTAAADG